MAEKTIRAVYAQKKVEHPTGDDVNNVLYEAMRKELRHAVDEIKIELEHAIMVRTTPALDSESCLQADNSNDQAVSKIRKNYATKLEKSEKRKQDLLVEIVMEEQRGRELSKIVRELHPGPKSSTIAGKPSRSRKRSHDRNKLSKRLTEEAEKYFEDFISNVEDTDLSSFDGERSDASSTLGVRKTRDPILHSGETETFQITAGSNSLPVEMDGVILPWLKWDASNDGSFLPSNHNRVLPVRLKSLMRDAAQEEILAQGPSGRSTSSRGSWSTGLESHSLSTDEAARSILKELASPPRSRFDMDRYLELKRDEDLMFERWKEQHRISSGDLLLCSNAFI
ncbi:Sister chromatid cohesion protein PDS5 B like [Actinidia chinensis var. chinensis]|uniref:Sister chromatid cohesion protein PDS5 B like n=1 Tax=Actinidia chinensis var. chinensis TaxID=1590841 RepID=A0A2R6PUI9_ACTCC|nr:Sister chromatid cohesion protein PDS5 B like [Actinidia chinensis var. chinensis]